MSSLILTLGILREVAHLGSILHPFEDYAESWEMHALWYIPASTKLETILFHIRVHRSQIIAFIEGTILKQVASQDSILSIISVQIITVLFRLHSGHFRLRNRLRSRLILVCDIRLFHILIFALVGAVGIAQKKDEEF